MSCRNGQIIIVLVTQGSLTNFDNQVKILLDHSQQDLINVTRIMFSLVNIPFWKRIILSYYFRDLYGLHVYVFDRTTFSALGAVRYLGIIYVAQI